MNADRVTLRTDAGLPGPRPDTSDAYTPDNVYRQTLNDLVPILGFVKK